MLPIAIDAMGGDRAPEEIVAGARHAFEQFQIPILLVGRPESLGDVGPLEVLPATEVIEMDDDPAASIRKKKDASVVVAAEAVRDGKASAMVSAGNTGGAMASALLRLGRIPGLARPAVATPIPVPGSTPTILLDAGANSECSAAWLGQFARMGSILAAERYGIAKPKVGLLSIGEESTKGTTVVKETHALLNADDQLNFIGNVEGRDIMTDAVDVVVTDGFTGNVVLKTLEGAMKFMVSAVMGAMSSTDEARTASKVLMPTLHPLQAELDPETHGGAMLLGVDGVCIISHGSSSARAIVNATKVAHDMVKAEIVTKLREAIS